MRKRLELVIVDGALKDLFSFVKGVKIVKINNECCIASTKNANDGSEN